MCKVVCLILFLIPLLYYNSVICEDFTGICRRNNIIKPVQAFRVRNVSVLFLTIDGETKVVRLQLNEKLINDKRLARIPKIEDIWPKPNSEGIKLWPNWNVDVNNKTWNELNDFISVFQVHNYMTNSLVFTNADPGYNMKYLIGYRVIFDPNVTRIQSVTKFPIDPYRADEKDAMNLKSLFANFPNEFVDRATPIVGYQVPQTRERRVFIYYNEINPRNPTQSEYKVHFLIHNSTANQWFYDETNAECAIKNNTNLLVKAAFDVNGVQYYLTPFGDYTMNLVEFYEDGKYGKTDLLIKKPGVVEKASFIRKGSHSDIRDIICLKPRPTLPPVYPPTTRKTSRPTLPTTQPSTQPSTPPPIKSTEVPATDTTIITTVDRTTISPIITTSTSKTDSSVISETTTDSSSSITVSQTSTSPNISSPIMIETTFGEQSTIMTTKTRTKPPPAKPIKSSKWWIWVVVILALLIGAAVIGLFFYLKSRKGREEENIEMRGTAAAEEGAAGEAAAGEGAAVAAEGSEGDGSIESSESLRTDKSETEPEESLESSEKSGDESGSESVKPEKSETSDGISESTNKDDGSAKSPTSDKSDSESTGSEKSIDYTE